MSYLSLEESMCRSVFVKVSHGNTENFRHLTDSRTARIKGGKKIKIQINLFVKDRIRL